MGIPNVKIDELMTKDVIIVTKEDTVQSAAQLMRNYSIKCIPVVNNSKEIVGMVSARDIIDKIVSENRNNSIAVEEIMTRENIIFAHYDNNIIEVSEILNKNNLSVIPIINKKEELVGIISKSDLLSVYPLLIERFER
ncbi:MAG: CBS domain-containing protein [Candidatus Aenigmarchaeota archaeon]|nr:CBS domain-containing protein [Candidatus Aenigmarchaeota archaeon]